MKIRIKEFYTTASRYYVLERHHWFLGWVRLEPFVSKLFTSVAAAEEAIRSLAYSRQKCNVVKVVKI